MSVDHAELTKKLIRFLKSPKMAKAFGLPAISYIDNGPGFKNKYLDGRRK